MSSKIFFIVCLVILKVYTEKAYKVVSYRFIDQPLLSKSLGSQYEINRNPTVFEYNNSYFLIVRCQNSLTCQSGNESTKSWLVLTTLDLNHSNPIAEQIVNNSKFIYYDMQYTNEGFESFDPRITLWNNSYYMFYTNNYNCLSPFVTCAITNTPSNMSKWVTQGVPLDSVPTSSVSAPLFATSENGLKQHYLFWSNAQDNLGIAIATNPEYLPYGTSSPSPWNDTGLYLMTPRKDYFDSRWIEPGPPPVRLNSSGDFLFLYNSGNNASVRFAKSTNVGYVILDGKDPTQIVQRSLDPLIIPGLAWETSPETLTMSGLIPHPKGCPDKNILRSMLGTNFISHADCFIGFYGTSKDTGAILVVASWVDMNI